MKQLTILSALLFMFFFAKGQTHEEIVNTYENAKECYKNGNYECAILNFTRYKNAENADVAEEIRKAEECKTAKFIADSYYNSNDWQNAVTHYKRICDLNPDDSYAKSRYEDCLKIINPPPKESPRRDWKIGGRNVSFGLSGGLTIANFKTEATGSYIGSAIDYGYGDDSEQPLYISGLGGSAGILLDIRAVQNFYIQIGINYMNAAIKNSFQNSWTYSAYNSGTSIDVDPSTTTTYVEGNGYDKFSEKYTLHYIEIPLLFSYRLKMTEKINFQINVGPYLGIGLAGKCTVTGSTDWPELIEYNKFNDLPTGEWYWRNYEYDGELELFGIKGNNTLTNTANGYTGDYSYAFAESPLKRLNAGISLGAGFELGGFNIGFQYDWGLMNIANEQYWNTDRMNITNDTGDKKIVNYKHKLNRLQVKIGYIFRW